MTALHVDLDALAHNLSVIRGRVAPASHMLVVKDDAYGHGLVPVVRRAWEEGVTWFGAFDVRTGSVVRAALGPGPRVFVWVIGSLAEARAAVAADLDIGVGDADLLEDVAAAAAGSAARVHLKIDTGLHRNGVRPEEWPEFVARAAALEQSGAVRVVGIWSHIAEASDADDDAARTAFDSAVAAARAAGLRPDVLHLAASAASFARDAFRYDIVRVGAFAYGIRPAGGPAEEILGIRSIARLTANVVEVGGAVRLDVSSLDGLPSTLGGRVAVGTPGGSRALLGLDESGSTVEPWTGARVGDEVTVYGPGDDGEDSVTGLAERIDSIGEELALRLSPLVARVYTGAGTPDAASSPTPAR